MSGLAEELGIAEEIARHAGSAAMRFYGRALATAKADSSPVTEADHAANDIIVASLRERFPDDAVLSEESEDSASRLSSSRVWIVDPLDGTREFLLRNGEFAVMIGLAIDGRALLGVVHLPATGEVFGAAAGEGAWVATNGERHPLRRLPPPDPRSLRMVGSRSHSHPLVERFSAAIGIRDVLPSGSVGVKCARIATDQRDLYLHPVPYLKEWDTCAPEVILREAGGTVTDCLGETLRYNKPDPRQPHGIMACAPGVFEAVIDTWRTMYPQAPDIPDP